MDRTDSAPAATTAAEESATTGEAVQHAATELFLNRELGVLTFNERVLALAESEGTPLLERLRFLCIVSSNLDEFFEIRVAGLKEQILQGLPGGGADGRAPAEVLEAVSARAHRLVERQYQLLNGALVPQLREEGIVLHMTASWDETQTAWAREIFLREVMPLLTPIGLDPAHPFPRVLNKSLNFAVTLSGKDAFKRKAGIAVVQAPRALPRVYPMPERLSGYRHGFVLLSSLLQAFMPALFPGMTVGGVYQFRVTRNSDLFVDEEEVTNLRLALQGELSQRHYGDAVRLELSDATPPELTQFLLREFGLQQADCYRVDGPVNVHRLMQLADLVDRPELKYRPFTPGTPAELTKSRNKERNFFQILARQDVLLHHPYQSFQPVIDFLTAAANDPHVMAIKQTIYRTGTESVLMDALLHAARSGKEVTVVVELMARFDEETNINWAARLEEVGAHVVYGVVGHKTHAKLCLVLRKEKGRIRRYAHLGTGNYHPRTARIYTDFGLFTAQEELCEDVDQIFHELTGLGEQRQLKRLLQSPFTMHHGILQWIRRETAHAKAGRPARIIVKMNALLEPTVIRELYTASQAGVEIDLIVRGVCALRPGVPGLSENIRVRSVIGRFLEHPRVYYFANGGEEEVHLASADWMDRNFFRRIEVAFPVLEKTPRKRVIEEGFMMHLRDTELAWAMQPDGSYRPLRETEQARHNAHEELLGALALPC
jgi:polyphosphate kinase